MKIALRRTALLTAPLLAAASLALVATPAAQAATPANDSFANAQVLTTGVTATGSNVGATQETGEPNLQNSGSDDIATERTVWYKWTAPTTESYTVATGGSDLDTYLGVFTGDSVGSLDEVGDDDDGGPISNSSSVTFDAVAGTTYAVQVDGYQYSTTAAHTYVAVQGSISLGIVPTSSLETVDATISGTVTDASGTAVDACVHAYSTFAGASFNHTVEEGNGTFTLNLPAGAYSLVAWPCDNASALGSGATTVTLRAGDAVAKDVRLTTGATFAGHLTLPEGTTDAAVDAYNQVTGDERSIKVDPASGNYALPGLGSGGYIVSFSYTIESSTSGTLYQNSTLVSGDASHYPVTSGCAYHNVSADFTTGKTTTPTGACTAPCASAKKAATDAGTALAAKQSSLAAVQAQRSVLRANATKTAKALKKAKKAHQSKKRIAKAKKAKTLAAKKLQQNAQQVAAATAAVSAATAAATAANAATAAPCA